MLVTIKSGENPSIIAEHIRLAINERSRFTCEVETVGKTRFKIRNIRLKESKRYCGSHPYACDIEGGRMGKYLEGADWVEVNDRINDVLDFYEVEAWVRSAVCTIRRGRERRVEYDGYPLGHAYQWNKEGEMEDWCGRIAPDSWYPEGTPGLYERKVDERIT